MALALVEQAATANLPVTCTLLDARQCGVEKS